MKQKLLFVEDERWGVSPYFFELEKNGFECILAQNGDEAVRSLRTNQISLISMDIMFPPGKVLGEVPPINAGLKLLEMIRRGKIRNCNPNIDVIILTAVPNFEIETQIRKLNVSAYLKKPIDFSTVIETFSAIKKESLKNEEQPIK